MVRSHLRHGFTLIELLVVITIIVVLLALLTPALDKAVYQAQLAVCASNLKSVSLGAQVYAMSNRQFYPERRNLTRGGAVDRGDSQPMTLVDTIGWDTPADDRAAIRAVAAPLNATLNDPLTKAVDLETQLSTWVMGSYPLWFGMYYQGPNGGGKGMRKLGDRFQWTDTVTYARPVTGSFNVLATDFDFYTLTGRSISSHPDHDGVMSQWTTQDEAWEPTPGAPAGVPVPGAPAGVVFTFSRWERNGGPTRGPSDFNYAYADGSTLRLNHVVTGDDRMAFVPYQTDNLSWSGTRLQLPRQ